MPVQVVGGGISFDADTSGVVTNVALASGAVLSGNIASGQVGAFHIASGQLTGSVLGSGAIVSGHIASGQIGSFHIGSGQLTGFELGSGAIVSGRVASGQLGSFHFGSGAIAPNVGGLGFVAGETLSGFCAATLTSGGVLALAMAGSGLRLPALGIVPAEANVLSGGLVSRLVTHGLVAVTSGLDATWSGQVGFALYAGSGGVIVDSGGLVSGVRFQRLGVAVSGGIFANVSSDVFASGVGFIP